MDCVGYEAKGQKSPIRSVGLRLEVRDRKLLSCCKACLEWTHSQVASKISETRKSKDPDGMGRLFTNTKANTVLYEEGWGGYSQTLKLTLCLYDVSDTVLRIYAISPTSASFSRNTIISYPPSI